MLLEKKEKLRSLEILCRDTRAKHVLAMLPARFRQDKIQRAAYQTIFVTRAAADPQGWNGLTVASLLYCSTVGNPFQGMLVRSGLDVPYIPTSRYRSLTIHSGQKQSAGIWGPLIYRF